MCALPASSPPSTSRSACPPPSRSTRGHGGGRQPGTVQDGVERSVTITSGQPAPVGAEGSRSSRPCAGSSSRRAASREAEEQPLQLLTVGLALLRAVGHALLQPARDQLEPRPVQRPRHRRQLRDHVLAVPPGLDHLNQATDLPLRPAQPLHHVRKNVLTQLPHASLRVPPRVSRRTRRTSGPTPHPTPRQADFASSARTSSMSTASAFSISSASAAAGSAPGSE